MVGTGNANTNAPSDAAIVMAKPATGTKALALTTDCNSRYVYADPYIGTMIAVAEAARNIVCSGGEPLGVTNCLNFGNPYDPEVYYQFVMAIKGMGDACRKFDTPVTGGNVSFYNQSPEGTVYPTPTIGMVGLLEIDQKITLDFKQPGDTIFLLGKPARDINSSEYIHKLHGVEHSPPPYFNIDEEFVLHRLILSLNDKKLIASAHDTSEGGLIVTLLESGFPNSFGFEVTGSYMDNRKDAFWFGESQGRVVVSVTSLHKDAFLNAMQGSNVACTELGRVTSSVLTVDGITWGDVTSWKNKYDNALTDLIKDSQAEQALIPL